MKSCFCFFEGRLYLGKTSDGVRLTALTLERRHIVHRPVQHAAYQVCKTNATQHQAYTRTTSPIHDTQSASELLCFLRKADDLSAADVALAWLVASEKNLVVDKEICQLSNTLINLGMGAASQMTPAELGQLAWGVSSWGGPAHSLLRHIACMSQTRISSFRPKEACAVLWACANGLSQQDSRGLFVTLSALVEGGMTLELFTPEDLAVLVAACSKVGLDSVFHAIDVEVAGRTEEFSNLRDISRLLRGFADLDYQPVESFHGLTDRCGHVLSMTGNFDPFEVGHLSLALGRLYMQPSTAFYEPYLKTCTLILSDETSKSWPCAAIIWCEGRLQRADRVFHKAAVFHLSRNFPQYSMSELAVSLWGIASLKGRKFTKTEPLLTADMVKFLKASVCSGPSRSAASALWALAVLVKSKKDMEIARDFITPAVDRLLDSDKLTAEEVATTVVSIASLESTLVGKRKKFFQDLCIRHIHNIDSFVLADLSLAVVRLKWQNQVLLDALATAALKKSKVAQPSALAQVVWSLRCQGFASPKLAQLVIYGCLPHICTYRKEEFARVLSAWAFAAENGAWVGGIEVSAQLDKIRTVDEVLPSSLVSLLVICTHMHWHGKLRPPHKLVKSLISAVQGHRRKELSPTQYEKARKTIERLQLCRQYPKDLRLSESGMQKFHK